MFLNKRYGFKRIEESTTGVFEDKQGLTILNSLLADKSMPIDIIPHTITAMVFAGLETVSNHQTQTLNFVYILLSIGKQH